MDVQPSGGGESLEEFRRLPSYEEDNISGSENTGMAARHKVSRELGRDLTPLPTDFGAYYTARPQWAMPQEPMQMHNQPSQGPPRSLEVGTGCFTATAVLSWFLGALIIMAVCILSIFGDSHTISLNAVYTPQLQHGWLVAMAAITFSGTLLMSRMEHQLYMRIIGASQGMSLGDFMRASTGGSDWVLTVRQGIRHGNWAAASCTFQWMAHSAIRIVLAGALVIIPYTEMAASATDIMQVPDITATTSDIGYRGEVTGVILAAADYLVEGQHFAAYSQGFMSIGFKNEPKYQLIVDTTDINLRCEYSSQVSFGTGNRSSQITLDNGVGQGLQMGLIWGLPRNTYAGAEIVSDPYFLKGMNGRDIFAFAINTNCTDSIPSFPQGNGMCFYTGACMYEGETWKRRVTIDRANASIVYGESFGTGNPYNLSNYMAGIPENLNEGSRAEGGFGGGTLARNALTQTNGMLTLPRDPDALQASIRDMLYTTSTFGSMSVSRRGMKLSERVVPVITLTNGAALKGSSLLGALGLVSVCFSGMIVCWVWVKKHSLVCLVWNGVMAGAAWQDSILGSQLLAGKCAIQHPAQLEAWERELSVCLAPDDTTSNIGHISLQLAEAFHTVDAKRTYGLSRRHQAQIVQGLKARMSTQPELKFHTKMGDRAVAVVPVVYQDGTKPFIELCGNWDDWLGVAGVRCTNERKQWICLMAYWGHLMRRHNAILVGSNGDDSTTPSSENASESDEYAERMRASGLGLAAPDTDNKALVPIAVCAHGDIRRTSRLRSIAKVRNALQISHRRWPNSMCDNTAQQVMDEDFSDCSSDICKRHFRYSNSLKGHQIALEGKYPDQTTLPGLSTSRTVQAHRNTLSGL